MEYKSSSHTPCAGGEQNWEISNLKQY
jgi:hypothetical protein